MLAFIVHPRMSRLGIEAQEGRVGRLPIGAQEGWLEQRIGLAHLPAPATQRVNQLSRVDVPRFAMRLNVHHKIIHSFVAEHL